MAVSADSVRFALTKETTPGVVPASPVWDLMRSTGEGIAFAYESTTSNELGGTSRGVRDSILTGGSVTGPFNFELSKNVAFEDLLASILGSEWGYDPLANPTLTGTDFVYVSDVRQTFSVEKRFTMDPGSPDPYLYHRYFGMIPDTCAITITPGQPINGAFGMIGSTFDDTDTQVSGSTYVEPDNTPVMTAPLVAAITLFRYDGVLETKVFDVSTSCWTNLVINMASNNRAIPCIGTLGTRETVLGRFECNITYSVYFTSNFLLEALQTQQDYKLVVECDDAAGNAYRFVFPRVRISTGQTVASGTGEDVLVSGEMVALVGDTPNNYSLVVQRYTAPAAAALTGTATGAGASSTTVTITVNGGPATEVESHYIANLTPDAGAVQVYDHPVITGESGIHIARALAELITAGGKFIATNNFNVITVKPAGSTIHITAATVTVS